METDFSSESVVTGQEAVVLNGKGLGLDRANKIYIYIYLFF